MAVSIFELRTALHFKRLRLFGRRTPLFFNKEVDDL